MKKNELRGYSIGQSLTDQLKIADSMRSRIWQSVIAKFTTENGGLYNKEEKV